jgi:hypothetical protein
MFVKWQNTVPKVQGAEIRHTAPATLGGEFNVAAAV